MGWGDVEVVGCGYWLPWDFKFVKVLIDPNLAECDDRETDKNWRKAFMNNEKKKNDDIEYLFSLVVVSDYFLIGDVK